MTSSNQKISILGCGWYGLPLAKKLVTLGYIVKGSTTTADKMIFLEESGISPFLVNVEENGERFDPVFFDCDLLVISIPPKRNTAEQHSFLSKIKRIANAATNNKVQQIIFISSTSVYGDQNQEVTEDTIPIPDTDSGKVILLAEQFLQQSSEFTTTVLRFGGLIGPGRDPARFFTGKKDISNGLAPVNLIHLSDCIGITLAIIKKQAFGFAYNACSTDHPTRAAFYTLAAVRSEMEKPVFIDELQRWKLVTSINIPAHLGYTFKFSINTLVLQ